MTKPIQIIFILFFAVITSFSLNAQNHLDTLKNNSFIQIDFNKLSIIRELYPRVVIEIITVDGGILRGFLEDIRFVNDKKEYVLSDRFGIKSFIPVDSIQELHWTLSDRRESNLFFDISAMNAFNLRGVQNFTFGLSFTSGFEWGKGAVFKNNIYRQNEWDFKDSIRYLRFGAEFMAGYRLNRKQKNIHTLNGGLGFFSRIAYEGERTNSLSLLAEYEFDIQVTENSGLILSSKIVYLPYRNNAMLFLGIGYRFNFSSTYAEQSRFQNLLEQL